MPKQPEPNPQPEQPSRPKTPEIDPGPQVPARSEPETALEKVATLPKKVPHWSISLHAAIGHRSDPGV